MNADIKPIPERLGKYQVRREVGRGGMGVVYEGYDPLIDRRVALKTFLAEGFDGTQPDNLMTRLQREAQAAGRLSHRNIIAVYDFGEDVAKDDAGKDSKTAFIAMEFIEGRSLESYFQANERFPMHEVVRIMGELLDALEYSHSHGVVHRDIKPGNIILLADGTVKVGDFGIARIDSSTLTQAGVVLGSPRYMSQEQFMGQTVDGRSDIYSAAVVLYQLLTAEVPFTGTYTAVMYKVLNDQPPPPSALNVQVPKAFDDVLRRAMAKRPDERYQTATEFKQAIAAAATATAPTAGERTVMRPAEAAVRAGGGAAGRPKPLLRPAVLFTALAALSAAAGAGWYFWEPRHAPSRAVNSVGDDAPAPGANAAPPGGNSAPLANSLPAPSPGAPAAPAEPAEHDDSTLISAVGIAPAGGQAQDAAAVEQAVSQDARRQMIAKAAALYVQPSSLNANYAILRTKLLARSDDFITTVFRQPTAQRAQDGSTYGIMQAAVSVREVQKSLNQISREDRVEFIRNNGDPRISVSVRAWTPGSEGDAGPQISPVAENLLKEHIRSFGFAVVDDNQARPPADFHVDSEVRFKKLSAKLPASGLTIEKFALTSWTVRAVEAKSGEEVYHNTAIPQKQSWATEELALQDVGRMIGSEFSRSFFLQYFDYKPKKARLRFSGLPPAVGNAVLAALSGNLLVLNAALAQQSGDDVVIDTELSGSSASLPGLVQQNLLQPLNKKIGRTCFTMLAGEPAAEMHVVFDASCAAIVGKLEAAPQDGFGG
jgi:eukaryotic-like serine/threonine-protein kinase